MQDGQTALYFASKNGHTEVVEILQKAGAIFNEHDRVCYLFLILLLVALFKQHVDCGHATGFQAHQCQQLTQ